MSAAKGVRRSVEAFAHMRHELERTRLLNTELYEALEGFRLAPDRIVGVQGGDIILRIPSEVIAKAADALAKARGEP